MTPIWWCWVAVMMCGPNLFCVGLILTRVAGVRGDVARLRHGLDIMRAALVVTTVWVPFTVVADQISPGEHPMVVLSPGTRAVVLAACLLPICGCMLGLERVLTRAVDAL